MKCKRRQRCRNRGSDATLLVLENKRRSGGGSEWIWNQRKRENMRCYTPECFKASFWRHRLIFIRTEMLCSVKSYLLSCFTNKTFLKLFWWFLSTTAPTVSLLFVYRGNKDGALGAAYWQECQLACVSVHDQAWENELRARLRGSTWASKVRVKGHAAVAGQLKGGGGGWWCFILICLYSAWWYQDVQTLL